ncbi:hypothetical protein HYPSUDRAFT_206366 [Hypholoma sublateritium FD-334 SS-4]|uniref:Uncharacterized protein n=1 Tax=Hypholoma sublateritium (strain FD-334 SS-4) TaxID=945553 RepID=A0A0D2PA61_HYPSF|nr:hypothetical protein HYPSUDRAFT_206366 [Hypholoma sublateritium FD-334 SS-4]
MWIARRDRLDLSGLAAPSVQGSTRYCGSPGHHHFLHEFLFGLRAWGPRRGIRPTSTQNVSEAIRGVHLLSASREQLLTVPSPSHDDAERAGDARRARNCHPPHSAASWASRTCADDVLRDPCSNAVSFEIEIVAVAENVGAQARVTEARRVLILDHALGDVYTTRPKAKIAFIRVLSVLWLGAATLSSHSPPAVISASSTSSSAARAILQAPKALVWIAFYLGAYPRPSDSLPSFYPVLTPSFPPLVSFSPSLSFLPSPLSPPNLPTAIPKQYPHLHRLPFTLRSSTSRLFLQRFPSH